MAQVLSPLALENKRRRNRERMRKLRAAAPEAHREYQRKWREANRERSRAYCKKWRLKNPEKLRAQAKLPSRLEFNRRYRTSPKWREYSRDYQRERRRNDVAYNILNRLRCRLRQALRGGAKASTTRALVGCSTEELRRYLESQFKPGMAWGPEVHIDHVRPVAAFDLTDLDQQRACFHYTNLQPLWARENIAKSDNLAGEDG